MIGVPKKEQFEEFSERYDSIIIITKPMDDKVTSYYIYHTSELYMVEAKKISKLLNILRQKKDIEKVINCSGDEAK
ncbi:hypothetical protein [Pseudalkalibacillus hwajinpoensis]|uniref:Uncharacterized protein n=1 Tax=Guptibacillus hwajinpoensis TaxID=208199 RepID=A0A4U1MG18_9BACL|nr:hypothetical protein [Pseudalkalibacillus hwajinpoensis]TKD69236.1 hypothetical protein FBF83_14645 [Pseudalkalibacillus hwajinpoensis]